MSLWSVPTISTLEVVDVLLIAVVIASTDVAVRVWKARRLQLSSSETKLLDEYNAQVRLVNRLNSVETFVAQAKATRRMNALKKELQALAGEECVLSLRSGATDSATTLCCCVETDECCIDVGVVGQTSGWRSMRRRSCRSSLTVFERCVCLSCTKSSCRIARVRLTAGVLYATVSQSCWD